MTFDIAADQRRAALAPSLGSALGPSIGLEQRGRSRRRSRQHGKESWALSYRRAALAISAVLAGIGLAGALHQGKLAIPEAISAQVPAAADIVQAAGLGLDQVAITGHRFTSDEAIFKALDLDTMRSLWALDTKAARLRIEALPWVASAELTRLYPGQVDVRITERAAFAVWRRDGREELIDRTGRVLQAVAVGSVTHLPVIVGEDAAREANSLMVLLARYRPLADAFKLAERVNGRRWSVHLTTGGRIELPADGEALALAELEASRRLEELLAGAPAIIDLRAPGRVAIRPAAPGLASAPARQRSLAGIGALIEDIGRNGGQP